jgi:hypothetical protein
MFSLAFSATICHLDAEGTIFSPAEWEKFLAVLAFG